MTEEIELTQEEREALIESIIDNIMQLKEEQES